MNIQLSKYIDPKAKISIFIDAANIFYSQKTLTWQVDYLRLKEYFEKRTTLSGLHYYTGKVGKLEKQLKFIKKLEKIGYQVVTKEVKMIKISENKYIPKGNLDIELALDAYIDKDNYDVLALFSGDSDFAYLIDLLKSEGKQVLVFSTRGHISKELLERAKYIDLRRIKEDIAFKKNQELPEGTPEV